MTMSFENPYTSVVGVTCVPFKNHKPYFVILLSMRNDWPNCMLHIRTAANVELTSLTDIHKECYDRNHDPFCRSPQESREHIYSVRCKGLVVSPLTCLIHP